MISHNLAHVFDLCDHITVMKTGQVVFSKPVPATSRDEVLRYIVMGREAAA